MVALTVGAVAKEQHRVPSIRGSSVSFALLAIASLLLASCGGDADVGTTPASTRPPVSEPDTTVTTAPSTGPRAAARWETVDTLSGTGPSEHMVTVLPDALQWRARFSCETGSLLVVTEPAPRRPAPLVDAGACPDEGEGYSIITGPVTLDIEATGPWDMVIDQQLDRPLDEPPLPGMAPGTAVASGDFFPVETEGTGTATLYRLPDGTRALRFEDFKTAENTDLFVWISSAPSPQNSAEAVASPYTSIGNLKSTVGNQNYALPADLADSQINSVVIWCEPVNIAYTIAPLTQ